MAMQKTWPKSDFQALSSQAEKHRVHNSSPTCRMPVTLKEENPTVTKAFAIATLGLSCCLGLPINLHGQGSSDVASQIKQLQQESRDAQMKNDVSWAQQHLADGFMAGNSWGEWETKDEFIKDLQNKTIKWKSGSISDVKVASFGSNTAISHYSFTYDAQFKGKHRARTVICSDTWVNESGTWKTASTHCTLVKGM